jgi:hypothetical protein
MSGGGNALAACDDTSKTDCGLAFVGPVVKIASEQINPAGDSQVIPSSGTMMQVTYTFFNGINADFNMVFTLSGEAVWGAPLSSAALDSEGASGGISAPAITRVGGGTVNDSSVTFLVMASGNNIDQEDVFTFSFSIKDKKGTLASSGSDIKLSASSVTTFGSVAVDAGTPNAQKQTTVIKSDDGVRVALNPIVPAGSYKIDVSQGSTVFVSNSGSSASVAKLGTLAFESNAAVELSDLTTEWKWATDSAPSDGATASLVISNAPLKASIVDPGKVFIDVNNNGTYEAPTSTDAYDKDFIATAVTDTEATWTLSTAAAKKLVTTCGDTVSSCDIVVVADGTTPVEDQPEAPTATLNLKYSTGGLA